MKIVVNTVTKVKKFTMGDYNILDVADTIIVGHQTEVERDDLNKQARNLTGYIYQILLNDKKFGLWNFRNASGNCKGQKR